MGCIGWRGTRSERQGCATAQLPQGKWKREKDPNPAGELEHTSEPPGMQNPTGFPPKVVSRSSLPTPKSSQTSSIPPTSLLFFGWSKGRWQIPWSRMWPLVPRELGAPLGLGAAPPAPSPIPLGTSLLSRKHGAEPHVPPDTRASSKTPRFGKAQAFRGVLKPLTVSESWIHPTLGVLLGQSFWGCFLRFGH